MEKICRQSHTNNFFRELFTTFSDFYTPSDIEVKKKITDIILALAYKGRMIIVGRAGAVLTREIRDSFHIKLYAPTKWKIEQVKGHSIVGEEEAKKIINAVDQERMYLRNFFAGESIDQDAFDITFNCATFSVAEMAGSVLNILVRKKILQE